MKNPWLEKNPFMSLWLSGANANLRREKSGDGRGESSNEGDQPYGCTEERGVLDWGHGEGRAQEKGSR